MNFQEYLKIYNAQSKINKLAKRYKNKKIAVYGAGQFPQQQQYSDWINRNLKILHAKIDRLHKRLFFYFCIF